ncbi:MAG TPA: DUF3263 domain-containing protein [Micromonosporaceae bacterium]
MDAPALAAPEQPGRERDVPAQVSRDAAAIVDAAIAATSTVDTALPAPEQALLDFERVWWRRAGAKEQAIRDTFGMTPTRYYQALSGVLDLPAAMRYDAALVHRLRRVRAEATRARRGID